MLTVSTLEYKSVRKVSIRSLGLHEEEESYAEIQDMLVIIDENPIPASLIARESNSNE